MPEQRGLAIETDCAVCGREPETANHLFFECNTSKLVWKAVLEQCGIQREPRGWTQEMQWFLRKAKRRSTQSKKLRNLMAVTVYTLWMETNAVLHSKQATSVEALSNRILSCV